MPSSFSQLSCTFTCNGVEMHFPISFVTEHAKRGWRCASDITETGLARLHLVMLTALQSSEVLEHLRDNGVKPAWIATAQSCVAGLRRALYRAELKAAYQQWRHDDMRLPRQLSPDWCPTLVFSIAMLGCVGRSQVGHFLCLINRPIVLTSRCARCSFDCFAPEI